MKQRTSLLGMGFLAVILAVAPASAATVQGGSTGTIAGNVDADAAAVAICSGWGGVGTACLANGSVVEVRATGSPIAPDADCNIEMQIFLPNGKTLSAFNFELSAQMEVDTSSVCTLVQWKTFQGNQSATPGPVNTTGPNDKQIPIGANAAVPGPVPALGEWGMIFLGIGVLLAAIYMIRRRMSAQHSEA